MKLRHLLLLLSLGVLFETTGSAQQSPAEPAPVRSPEVLSDRRVTFRMLAPKATEDLIPFVQANYRVYADRDHRALAGLSRGGGQSLNIGLRHLDLFSRIGVFSAGGGANPQEAYKDVAASARKVNDQLKLFWIGIGTEDPGLANARRLSDFLNQAGIKHTFRTIPGAHTWIVWRRFLNEVSPMLFSPTSQTN